MRNLDELFDKTLELSEMSYDEDSRLGTNYFFLEELSDFPVLFNKDEKTLFIAFRGTNTKINSIKNIKNTIANILTDIGTTDPFALGNYVKNYDEYKENIESFFLGLKAHEGFLKSLSKLYIPIRKVVDDYIDEVENLVVTGHSAGGALAGLFYYMYSNDRSNNRDTIKISNVVTYGSPRFLYDDKTNKELYYRNCPNLLRVFNVNDIVTYVPFNKPLVGYSGGVVDGFTHVGKPIPLDSNLEKNSLNALTIQAVRNNVKNMIGITEENLDIDDFLESIKVTYEDKYLELLTQSLFESFKKVSLRDYLSKEEIAEVSKEYKKKADQLSNWDSKCEILKPLGIYDILLANPVGETQEQQSIAISALGGSILGMNNISARAHQFPYYRKYIDILKEREVTKRTKITEKIENNKNDFFYPPLVIDKKTILQRLEIEIDKMVEAGLITGLIEQDDIMSGSLIEY